MLASYEGPEIVKRSMNISNSTNINLKKIIHYETLKYVMNFLQSLQI